MSIHWKKLALVALICALPACGGDDDDDVAIDADVTTIDAAVNIDGPGSCLANNETCDVGADCCSGVCVDTVCVPPAGCSLPGEACDTAGDCCVEGACEVPAGGTETVCIPGLCTAETGSCTIDADCCSLNCDGGTCGDASGACLVRGEDCTADDECCSHNCTGTCAGSTANCDPIGESCSDGNTCCSDFCANSAGDECDGETDCRCLLVTDCRAEGEICSADSDCCNTYCDRPGGVAVGHCAGLGACDVVGEPCGTPGVSGACCSNACVDDTGLGVATCEFLGGCLPINEICTSGAECCSGSCVENGRTVDDRPVMRCEDATSCLAPGEVCFTGASANCCPNGGGSTGCEPAVSGVHRCFGGSPDCTLPGDECTDVSECCMDIPGISCEPGPTGDNICCLPDGTDCAFGDLCCSGVCAPDSEGNLVCNPGCVPTGGNCTTNSDCCMGCCKDDGSGGMTCSTDCSGCTLGQLGDFCGDESPCCPGLLCTGDVEFPTCQLE